MNVYETILSHFETFDPDFLSAAENVVNRIDDFSDEEEIFQAIDDGLIYTRDQWAVIEYYCTPQDADFDKAMEAFTDDILAIAHKLAQEQEK